MKGPAAPKVGILSVHSHGDRSFLDDQDLALVSGQLRDAGLANDLVVVVLEGGADPDAEAALARTLEPYQVVVYERVWSRDLVTRLRARLPGRTFVHCRGEHRIEDPPADWICVEHYPYTLGPLLRYLAGEADLPPEKVLRREAAGFVAPAETVPVSPVPEHFRPNLRPVVVNPERLPSFRTFALQGNGGCPYQADARENPVYAGVEIPTGHGRGCAFCTAGNEHDGRPTKEVADSVLAQLRYVRGEAPALGHLVLKDQNPFGYLADLVTTCGEEGIGGFTLMLETRADWILRGERRLVQALEAAEAAGIRLCLYLVGIENFSQPELDRYNKGIRAETNVAFLEALWGWRERFGDTLDLDNAAFGFVLFSPWTRMDDLRTNFEGIRRTRFDRLRGKLLHSRARLYPDTALYYLARRDGLLVDHLAAAAADNSRRYGYFPSNPWRFQDPQVARFAEVAVEVVERTGGQDQLRIFQVLLEAFDAAGERWADVDAARVLAAATRRPEPAPGDGGDAAPASPAVRDRFARLVRPLDLEGPFAAGWRFGPISVTPGRFQVRLEHPEAAPVDLELVPRSDDPAFARSRHYDLRYRGKVGPSGRAALGAVCDVILRNDA